MQHMFPDLALIRNKGLVEVSEDKFNLRQSESCAKASAAVERRMPALGESLDLTGRWIEDVELVQQDLRLTSLEAPMRRCIISQSSLRIRKGVPAAYLDAVNTALMVSATDEDMITYSEIYADCAKPYFSQLERLLLIERPAQVEKHRETLESLAQELVAAGYAP